MYNVRNMSTVLFCFPREKISLVTFWKYLVLSFFQHVFTPNSQRHVNQDKIHGRGPSLVLVLVQIYFGRKQIILGMGPKTISTKNSFLVQLICVDKNDLVPDQNIFGPLEGQGIRFSPQAKSIGLEQTTINPCVRKM